MEYSHDSPFVETGASNEQSTKHQIFIEESVTYDELVEVSDNDNETPVKRVRGPYKKCDSNSDNNIISAFRCDKCDLGFTCRETYRRHFKKYHIDGWLTCDLCNNQFIGKANLAVHMQRAHMVDLETNTRSYKCTECDVEVVGARRFSRHKMTHTTRTCPICGITLRSSSYTRHLLVHDPQRPMHTCELCNISFRSKETYRLHELWHEGKKFTCDICAQSFKGPYHLQKHKDAMHRGAFQCSACDLIFLTEKRLRSHERQLHIELDQTRPVEEFPFPCDECGQRFKHQYYVTKHKKLHEKQREELRFTCLDCGKKCHSETHLATHKFSHGDQSDEFKCEQCGESFAQEHDLINHMQLHQQEDIDMMDNVIEEVVVSVVEDPEAEEIPVTDEIVIEETSPLVLEDKPGKREQISKVDLSQPSESEQTVIQVIKVSSQSKPKFKKPTIIMK